MGANPNALDALKPRPTMTLQADQNSWLKPLQPRSCSSRATLLRPYPSPRFASADREITYGSDPRLYRLRNRAAWQSAKNTLLYPR